MTNEMIFAQERKAVAEYKARNELKAKLTTAGTKLVSESGEVVEIMAVNGNTLTCKGDAGTGDADLSEILEAVDSGFFKFA